MAGIELSDRSKVLAIIGQGYVGLPLAIEFGKKYPTLGFDINQARIEELNKGVDHTNEATPEQLRSAKHLIFSANINDIKEKNKLLFILSLIGFCGSIQVIFKFEIAKYLNASFTFLIVFIYAILAIIANIFGPVCIPNTGVN